MRGDHDELEIFIEIRLIPSRIDQKLKNKGRIHGFLKGKLTRRSWAIHAVVGVELCVVGVVSIEQHCGFKSAMNRLQFRFKRSHDSA